MGFIGLKAFPAAVVGGFGSLPGAIVGGLVIGMVESLSGFYLPEGFKDIAAYVVVLHHADGQAQRPVRRQAAQEGLTRCAFIFKTDYAPGHPAGQAWRPCVLVRACCWLALLVAPWLLAEYWLAQLTFVLIYADRRPGPDAAGRLHRLVLAGARGASWAWALTRRRC